MTVEKPQARRSRRLFTVSKVSLVLAMGLALSACKQDPAETQTAAPSATTAPEATPENAVSERVSAMSAEQLRQAARTAYGENRLYAPADDNAVEYYLALREKAPADAAVSSALTDLLPMTVIATEQSVQREDFDEAARLAALLERAAPEHPALARLKSSIETQRVAAVERAEQEAVTAEEQAERQAELEAERLAQQQQQQQEAARQLAAREAAARETATQETAQQQEAERVAAEQRAAEQRAAQQRAAQQAAPAAVTAADLRPLSTPAPRYPPAALRANQSGEVQVEFTVAVDGSVTSARVVRSNPARVFDREALNAVRSWRFQPLPAPVTTRRTIGFNPGN